MSAEPQLSPAEANRMLDCIRTKATRLQAIEEALQAPLTRAALALLGYGPDTGARWKRSGAPVSIGLACAAVLAGLKPYRA